MPLLPLSLCRARSVWQLSRKPSPHGGTQEKRCAHVCVPLGCVAAYVWLHLHVWGCVSLCLGVLVCAWVRGYVCAVCLCFSVSRYV